MSYHMTMEYNSDKDAILVHFIDSETKEVEATHTNYNYEFVEHWQSIYREWVAWMRGDE